MAELSTQFAYKTKNLYRRVHGGSLYLQAIDILHEDNNFQYIANLSVLQADWQAMCVSLVLIAYGHGAPSTGGGSVKL